MLPMPAGREASAGAAAALYERNRPERTLLYQLVEELYPAFKAHLAAQGSALPEYVEREFDESPRCGRLERGFFCRYAATPAMPSTLWRSAANDGAFAPVAVPGHGRERGAVGG